MQWRAGEGAPRRCGGAGTRGSGESGYGRERACGWSEFNLVTSHTGTGKRRTALSANGRCTITASTGPPPHCSRLFSRLHPVALSAVHSVRFAIGASLVSLPSQMRSLNSMRTCLILCLHLYSATGRPAGLLHRTRLMDFQTLAKMRRRPSGALYWI